MNSKLQLSGGRCVDVRQVSEVRAVGVLETVLLGRRVEMRAGGGERRLALADLVDVNGVRAQSRVR